MLNIIYPKGQIQNGGKEREIVLGVGVEIETIEMLAFILWQFLASVTERT